MCSLNYYFSRVQTLTSQFTCAQTRVFLVRLYKYFYDPTLATHSHTTRPRAQTCTYMLKVKAHHLFTRGSGTVRHLEHGDKATAYRVAGTTVGQQKPVGIKS